MRISTLAWANLKRRRSKALLLTLGITIGIGTVVALVSLGSSIQEEIGAQLDRFGANILIVPQSDTLALNYAGVSVPGIAFNVHQLRNEDVQRIREIAYHDRLAVIAPKALSLAEVNGQNMLLAGVDFGQELKLHRWWQINGDSPRGEDQLLVGYEAAQALSLVAATQGPGSPADPGHAVHDHPAAAASVTIVNHSLRINGREHRVAGVIGSTGGPEDHMVFGELGHVQALANQPGQLNVIEVSALCKGCPVEDIVAQISAKLPHAKVSAVQQAVKAQTEMVERLSRFSAVVGVVVLVIGSLMIFTTMLGAVVERTKEIGVLRALGFRRSQIIKGLVLEVAIISSVGGILGWGAGVTASWVALPHFRETARAVELHPSLLLVALGAALVIGVASSIYPAFRASELDPSEAVRAF